MRTFVWMAFGLVTACAPDESKLWSEFQAKWSKDYHAQISSISRRPAQSEVACFESRFPESLGKDTPQQWFKKQTGVEMIEQEHQFTPDQWKAWWKFAHLVPPALLSTDQFKKIVHVPKSKVPAEWRAEGVCARSIPGGFEVSDECLSYSLLMHEFAHQFIWQQASLSAWAESEAWQKFLKFSGWKLEEFVDEAGVTKWKWMSNEDAKFVSTPARHSPFEDLSETIAFYRTQGDWVKERAPDKYQWVKAHIYQGRAYDSATLTQSYVDRVVRGALIQLETWAGPCLKALAKDEALIVPAAKLNVKVGPVFPSELKSLLGEKRIQCLETSLVNEVDHQLAQIRIQEPDACKVLSKVEIESEVISLAIPQVSAVVPGMVDVEGKLVAGAKGLELFRKALEREFQVQSLIQKCMQDEEPSKCYQAAAVRRLKEIEEKHRGVLAQIPEKMVEAEMDDVLMRFPVEEAVKMLRAFYVELAEPVQSEAKTRAESIWKSCQWSEEKGGISVGGKPTGAKSSVQFHFTAGEQYLSRELEQCLNHETTLALRELQQKIESGQKEKFEFKSRRSMRLLWNHGLIPVFEKIYFEKLKELSSAQERWVHDFLAKQSASDLSQSGATQPSAAPSDEKGWSWLTCKKKVSMHLASAIPSKETTAVDVGPGVDRRANEICTQARVQASNQLTGKESVMKVKAAGLPKPSYVSPGALPAPEAQIWKAIEREWVSELEGHFQECRKEAYSTARLKRHCLLYARVQEPANGYRYSIWERTRTRVLEKWIKSPEALAEQKRLGVTEKVYRAAVHQWISDHRQKLVDATLAAFGAIEP